MFAAVKKYIENLFEVPEAVSPERYRSLARLMTLLMVAVSVMPLLILSGFTHVLYSRTLEREMESPLYALARKSRTSLELFLAERASTVSLIAHANSFADLEGEKNLNRIFLALKSEFNGFVDIGLVDAKGRQVAYVGPYELKNADYSGQEWLREAEIKGRYISNVFLGLRGYPHMVIAVHRLEESGAAWTLRVTIDTSRLEQLVSAVGPDQDTDIFICDGKGVLQTNSHLYGKALDPLPFALPPAGRDTYVRRVRDDAGRPLLAANVVLADTDLNLVALKPVLDAARPWSALKSELLFVLLGGIVVIVLVSRLLIKHLVGRLQSSAERRMAIFSQMEHDQKLSSIGRLAAGVAHEVNNPLAVINEKAGLGLDLLELMDRDGGDGQAGDHRRRLAALLEGIESTVERARGITHRLLGFSRRMEANRQDLRVEEVVGECLEFLAREARSRGVEVRQEIAPDLPGIVSDRGQLQQVVLNLLGNALDAVSEVRPQGGLIEIRCDAPDPDHVRVAVHDNGKGMSAEAIEHIFEPFYSTKGDKGTGLGMFITYGIVRRLGGEIEVRSVERERTDIAVTLPLRPPAPEL